MRRKEGNSIKGVIFDLDGTLIESLEAYTQALNQGLQVFGLGPVSKKELATFLNRALGLEDILLEMFPCALKNAKVRRKCMDKIRKAYLKLDKEVVQLTPGAEETLVSIKAKGLKVGVVTARTTTGEMKWLELRRLGIAQFIDAIVTGAEAKRKPAPDSIIRCLERLGLSSQDAIFVGDAQADIIAAKRAKIRVISVSTGVADRETLVAQQPTMVIGNLTQLLSRI